MPSPDLLTLRLATEGDVLGLRRRVRELAALLNLDEDAQSRLATATAEVAVAGLAHGDLEVAIGLLRSERVNALHVTVAGLAHELAVGGADLDLDALQHLVDRVETRDAGASATLRLTVQLPVGTWIPRTEDLRRAIGAADGATPTVAADELRRQNDELVRALGAARERQAELVTVNRELADTNRAIGQLYDELDARTDDLRAAGERHRMLASTLAHELRTPLFAIEGIVEAVRSERGAAIDADLQRDLSTIVATIKEALTLVNDQLDTARAVDGRTVVRRSDVDLAELLGALRGMLGQMPRAAGVQFVVEEPAGLPTLRTDAGKLSQILRNLVTNALKFTAAGEVRVRAEGRGDEVHILVSDTGIGMREQDVERAFEPFTQLVETGVTPIPGSGLGLALSQGLAQVLGGRIMATSEPGVGSTFTVVLPLEAPVSG